MDFVVQIFLLHVMPLALAIWGAFNRRPWVFAPSILTLLFYPIGYWLSETIVVDGMFGAGFGFLVAGPLNAPIYLVEAAAEAPTIGVPILLLCIAVAWFIWRLDWRRSRSRLSVATGFLAGVGVSLLATEVSTEILMRIRASQQMPDYCRLEKLPAMFMLPNALSDRGLGRSPHAYITNGRMVYHWSFARLSFYSRSICAKDVYQCRC